MIESVFVPKGTLLLASTVACNRNKELRGEDTDEMAFLGGRTLVHRFQVLADGNGSVPFAPFLVLSISDTWPLLLPETVLSLLLSNFQFSRCDKPVFWNHSGVSYPSTGLNSAHPELWMRVSKYTGPGPQ
ncbi:hypothetical protein LXA43DRAFT_1088480 [Ganoderma leucocontextum]|nr:hypothetical protein LXA43DRAFT_1088480 [Ganoderma leucocontextum]